MSIWSKLREALTPGAGSLLDIFSAPQAPEKTVAFTVAVIALGAKMAKADGRVTRDEVTMFRRVFQVNSADLPDVGRFFDLAKRDAAGYDSYARKIARMFEPASETLQDVLDGLFHIAVADGVLKDEEDSFLRDVARIFGFDEPCYQKIRMRFVPPDQACPYTLLGVGHDASDTEIRKAWRALAAESHPDRLSARGVPEEALKIASDRMAAINAAYDAIRKQRAAMAPAS